MNCKFSCQITKATKNKVHSSTTMVMFNLFPQRPAKTDPFIILHCLTPDNFTHQEREPMFSGFLTCNVNQQLLL